MFKTDTRLKTEKFCGLLGRDQVLMDNSNALILSETLALYKSFTYLLTYLLTQKKTFLQHRVM